MTIRRLAAFAAAICITTSSAAIATAQEAERPNLLIILADDLGYSDIGAYGGEIPTPNIDALAADGLMFTNFYTQASCAPTRSMLLSGTDNHLAGVGQQSPVPIHAPIRAGYEAKLNLRVAAMPELLQEGGYHTIMAGKWHLGHEPALQPQSRGFDDAFYVLEGGSAHFKQKQMAMLQGYGATFLENGKPVELPDDFFTTTYFTDYIIEKIGTGESDKPFFAYAAYTAPHWPIQAPDDYLEAQRGKYDEGYDVIANRRLDRQRELGLAPQSGEARRFVDGHKSWDGLNAEEKAVSARKMEAYAAMVAHLDHEIGRLIGHLKATGKYDDTFVLFLSDNGAEGVARARPDWVAAQNFDNRLENLGRANSFVEMGPEWAQVSSTPFRSTKYTPFEGGNHVPAVIRYPDKVAAGRTDAMATIKDVLPTFLDLAGLQHPGIRFDNRDVFPMTGSSMMPLLTGQDDRIHDEDAVFGWELNMFSSLRKGDWKLVFAKDVSDDFQLFDLASPEGEWKDRMQEEPEKARDMMRLWKQFVTSHNVEVDDRLRPASARR